MLLKVLGFGETKELSSNVMINLLMITVSRKEAANMKGVTSFF